MDKLFSRLQASKFRSSFRLRPAERTYLAEKGLAQVVDHGRQFLKERLVPAFPLNDGSQTPTKGHPIFVAQHATGLCCRSCLKKWHGIENGREITATELEYLVSVLGEWLTRQNVQANESVQLGFFADTK